MLDRLSDAVQRRSHLNCQAAVLAGCSSNCSLLWGLCCRQTPELLPDIVQAQCREDTWTSSDVAFVHAPRSHCLYPAPVSWRSYCLKCSTHAVQKILKDRPAGTDCQAFLAILISVPEPCNKAAAGDLMLAALLLSWSLLLHMAALQSLNGTIWCATLIV